MLVLLSMSSQNVACQRERQGLLLQVDTPLMQLHTKAVAAPLLWAPVMATCLLNHSHDIPQSLLGDVLQNMHLQSFADLQVQAEQLWMLRYCHALATAWPTDWTSGRQNVQQAGVPVSTTSKQWKVCPVFHLLTCM